MIHDETFLGRLQDAGYTFQLVATSGTQYVVFGDEIEAKKDADKMYIKKPDSNHRLLQLIKAVQGDAKKYMEREKIKAPPRIEYFRFDEKELQLIDTGNIAGWKIDINAAYWNEAHRLFMSDTTYNLGIQHKKYRLKALGSLATRYKIRHYEDGKFSKTTFRTSPTANLYYQICHSIDKKMSALMQQRLPGVLGYWVDCIFYAGTDMSFLGHIIEYFKKNNLEVSLEHVEFSRKKENGYLYLLAKSKENEREKEYFIGELN